MTITARFASQCARCHTPIAIGDRIEWVRGQGSYHISCPASTDRATFNAQDLRPAPFNQDTQRDEDDDSYNAWLARPQNRPAPTPEQIATRLAFRATGIVAGTDADDRSYDAWVAAREAADLPPVQFDADGNVVAAAPAAAPRKALTVEDAGVYVLPNGDIVKVQANRAKTNTYAKRWVVINGERLTEADTRARGEYVYEAGLIGQVAAEGRKMTLEEAKAFIIRYGICARCSRQLKAAESVERGIGPICIGYFGGGATGAAVITAPAAVSAGSEETKPEYPHWDHRGPFCHVTDYFCSSHGYARCTACPDAPEASVQAPQAPLVQIDDSEDWSEQGSWVPSNSARSGSDWRARLAEQKGAWGAWTNAVGQPGRSRWTRPSDDDLGHAAGYGADEY